MKEQLDKYGRLGANNTFQGGLTADLSPIATPASIYTDALNMEFVTVDGDQYILQNIRGNKKKFSLGTDIDGWNFIPLGMAVFNNIAYILSGSFGEDGEFGRGIIGTYPSPDWDALNSGSSNVPMLDEYSPLKNFSIDLTSDYTKEFASTLFKFDINRHIDIQLVGSYDGSVDVIFTDDKNDIRLINSRFIVRDNGRVDLADRVGTEDSNTYSDVTWARTKLLNLTTFPIEVSDVKLRDTGRLFGGGYRFYFKYSTQEGNFSDIIYESPFIPVARDGMGVSGGERTSVEVIFHLSKLSRAYVGIKVYFEHQHGSAGAQIDTFSIDEVFSIDPVSATCEVGISGYENFSPVDPSEINASITTVNKAKSLAIVNNRLLIANTEQINDLDAYAVFKDAASKVRLELKSKVLNGDYGDADNVIKALGYWDREVYEFGVVFMQRYGGLSPVFPTSGLYIDNDGTEKATSVTAIRAMLNEPIYIKNEITDSDGNPIESFDSNIRYFDANVEPLVSKNVSKYATGYFIVRRNRLKNILIQGMLTPTSKFPTYNRSAGVTKDGYLFYAENRGGVAVNSGQSQKAQYIQPTTDDNIRTELLIPAGIGIDEAMDLLYLSQEDIPNFPSVKYVPQPSQFIEIVDPWGGLMATGATSWSTSIGKTYNVLDFLLKDQNGDYVTLGPFDSTAGKGTKGAGFVDIFDENIFINTSMEGADMIPVMFNDPSATIKRPPPAAVTEAAFYSGDLETLAPSIAEQIRSGIGAINIFEGSDVMSGTTVDNEKQAVGYINREILTMSSADAEAIARDKMNASKAKCRSCYWYSLAQCWGDRSKCRDKATRIYNQEKNRTGDAAASKYIIVEPVSEVTYQKSQQVFDDIEMLFIPNGAPLSAPDQFTGKLNKELSYIKEKSPASDTALRNYSASNDKLKGYSYATADAGTISEKGYMSGGVSYTASATIIQNYSKYIGVKVKDTSTAGEGDILFKYKASVFKPGGDLVDFIGEHPAEQMYCNLGNLANLYNSRSGEWTFDQFEDIFSSRGNKPYFAVSDRYATSDTTRTRLEIFRGDGYINKTYKRITYKVGVGVPGATPGEAGIYGRGLRFPQSLSGLSADPWPVRSVEQADDGKGLYDIGTIIGLVSMTNSNTLMRSVERVSAEDTAVAGGDRKFYPLASAERLREDARPDSEAYNHGYTGDPGVMPYFSIDGSDPTTVTEFPNRVIASPQNTTQQFFNSFKDIRGFNFRDYGVDVGPIYKIVGIDGMALLVHYGGVLAIGIDERTLLGEGKDVVVDSAQALSPKALYISSEFGTQHTESVVRTGETVYGVDYNKTAIWVFVGKNLKNISEFTVKTVVLSFKDKIKALGGVPRVYSVYNRVKHNVVFTFMSEDSDGIQTQVGALVYSTLLEKWVSRLSDGNKFLVDINSRIHTFSSMKPNSAWEEDALYDDDTGEIVRCNIRGKVYDHEFEIVINSMPHLEKILDSIKLISNKSIPDTIIYTTSGEVNDAALAIYGKDAAVKVLEQTVHTRGANKTSGVSRLSIIQENAYYKNSTLNISVRVGKVYSKTSSKRIRDKAIKVKFKYSGTDETFVQAIISTLSKSYG